MADSGKDVEVKLGADYSEVKSGSSEAATSVEQSLAKIQASLDGLKSTSKKTSEDVKTHTNSIGEAFNALHESIRGRIGSINSLFLQFSSKLAAVAGIFAGGALFKGSVESLLHLEDAVRGLVITFGLSTEAATKQAVALRLAGISAEQYEQMGQRVGRVLKSQSDEFDRLGVVYKDTSGNLLPMDQILQNVYTRMQDFKAGADQTEFALSTVGRNAKDFASDMQRLGAVQERATQLMHDLNIEMGPDRIAQVEAYRINLNAFKVVVESIGEKIGEAVLPRLEGLASWFNDYGPTAVTVIVNAVKGLLTVLQILGTLIVSVVIYGVSRFENLATSATASWQAIKAAATFNFGAIPGIMAAANAKIEANNRAAAESVAAAWKTAYDKIQNLWGGSPAPAAGKNTGLPKSGNERFKFKPTGTEESAIPSLENELKAEEDAYNKRMLDQGSFQTWSITQTRDYWEEVLAMSNLSAKDRIAAENKYYDAERQVQQKAFAAYIAGLEAQKAALGHNIAAKIEIAETEFASVAQRYGKESAEAQAAYKHLVDLRQQLADQRIKIAEIEAKAEEATAKHGFDMAKLGADQQLALRQINAQQRFAIEADYLAKEYALEVDAINQRIALMASDPNSDPVKLAELKAQLLKVEQDYQIKLTTLSNQAELERKQAAITAAQDVENAFGTFIDDLISRNKSLKQSFQDLVKGITADLNKLASQEIAKQLFGPGTTGGGFLNSIFGKIFGGGAGSTAIDAAHTEAVTADTTATATLTASLLSANTALTTFTASLAAGGGGFGGGIGSLFGGGAFSGTSIGGGLGDLADVIPFFDVGTPYVPQDTLAVVHKGEAVIPARANRPGAMGHQITTNITFNIGGQVDSRTLDQIHAATARGVQRATRSIM